MKRTYYLGQKSDWRCYAWVWTNEYEMHTLSDETFNVIDKAEIILRFTKGEVIHQYRYRLESVVCCVRDYSHLVHPSLSQEIALPTNVWKFALRKTRDRERHSGHDHQGYEIIKKFNEKGKPKQEDVHVCRLDDTWTDKASS